MKELVRVRDEVLSGEAPRLDVSIEEIKESYLEAMALERRPSYVEKLTYLLPKLIEALGAETVKDLSRTAINAYRRRRKAAGRASATVIHRIEDWIVPLNEMISTA